MFSLYAEFVGTTNGGNETLLHPPSLSDLPREVYIDADRLYNYKLPVGAIYYSRYVTVCVKVAYRLIFCLVLWLILVSGPH